MTPPEAQGMRQIAGSPAAPPAVSVLPDQSDVTEISAPEAPAAVPRGYRMIVIPLRADFLRAASARRQGTGSFLLQARDRRDGDSQTRIGFTASKKIGNSVARNRARRRMREVARAVLPGLGRPGWDYVLVARPGATITRDYQDLLTDLAQAFASVHRDRPPRGDKPREARPSEERQEGEK